MRRGPAETYVGLDAVRFGAALGVAFYHLGYWWWLPAQSHDVDQLFHSSFGMIAPHARWGNVGVQIFFVLSGFIIAASASGRSWHSFLKGRALRLYPAAWLAAGVLYLVRDSDADLLRRSLNTLALSPFGPWLSGVFWTLGVEIAFYALVAVAIAAGWRLWTFGALFGLLGSTFWLARLLDHATGGHLTHAFAAIENSVAGQLLVVQNCYFALGIALWSIHISGLTRAKLGLFTFFATAGLVASFSAARYAIRTQGGSMDEAIEPLLIWLFAVALIVCSIKFQAALWRRFQRWGPIVRRAGLATYPLYLIHSQLGRFIMLWSQGLGTWLSFALGVSAAIAVAFIIAALERWPRAALKAVLHPRPAKRNVASDLP
jgi:peptidoglycan/LPS O-acetylase OafA/YrhL